MGLSRRTLLSGAAAGAALTLITSKKAAADPVSIPELAALNRHALPDTGLGYGGYRILELFLHGGVAPWDTFYWVDRPEWRHRPIDDALAGCGTSSAGTFGVVDGLPVRWGPVTAPLHPFADVSRVVVHRQEFALHPLAVPMQMTGQRVGSPRLAGAGAAIQRYFSQRQPAATLSRSYVLANGAATNDNLPFFAATGAHGAASRPVELKLGAALTEDINSFDRTGTATGSGVDRTRIDPLIDALRAGYTARLTPSSGGRVRSRALDELEAAYRNHHRSRSLFDVLTGSWPLPAPTGCVAPGAGGSFQTGQALDVAARLLSTTAPDGRALAAYVGIVDSGVVSFGGAGYDTHGGAVGQYRGALGGNLNSTLARLAATLSKTGGAGKIDLRNTLVVITTEFGREPGARRDAHNPGGYASALIGGPYLRAPAGAAQRVSGSIDRAGLAGLTFPASTGLAIPTTPASFRAAILMAAGIGPVEPSTLFSTADLGAGTAAPAAVHTALAADVLGFLP